MYEERYFTEDRKQVILKRLDAELEQKLLVSHKLQTIYQEIEIATAEIEDKILDLKNDKKAEEIESLDSALKDPEFEKRFQQFNYDIKLHEQQKEENKLKLKSGDINFSQYQKFLTTNRKCLEFLKQQKDQLVRSRQNTERIKEYDKLLQQFNILKFKSVKPILSKILCDSPNYFSYVLFLINTVNEEIDNIKREIDKMRIVKTYPEDVANKSNILKIDLEDPMDFNLLMENWRSKYEAYAAEHNLFPEYQILLRLLENYYAVEGHPYPKTAVYCQKYPKAMLKVVIKYIMDDEVMEEECKILQMLQDKKSTLQKHLVEVCNKHRIDWLISNTKINLICFKHFDCKINATHGQNLFQCCMGFKYECKLKTESEQYLSLMNLRNFNLDSTLKSIDNLFIITKHK